MVDKHVVKLSIDTTLHRDLTIGEWTAVVVRDVLADHIVRDCVSISIQLL